MTAVTNALVTYYVYEVASKDYKSPHAAGQPVSVYGVKVPVVPETTLQSTLLAGLDLTSQGAKVYKLAQEAIKDSGILRFYDGNVHFLGTDRVITGDIVEAAVRYTSQKHPGKRAKDLANRLLKNNYTGGKSAPSIPWNSLKRSFRDTLAPKDDCAAYHESLFKDPRKMPQGRVVDIDNEIAGMMSDGKFLGRVKKWIGSLSAKQQKMKAGEPFRMSMGFNPVGKTDNIPHRMVAGMKVGWAPAKKHEQIAPYLVKKGLFYTTTKGAKGRVTKQSAARYCVANVGPIIDGVFLPAYRYYESTGKPMSHQDVLALLKDVKPLKKAPAKTQKARTQKAKTDKSRAQVAKEQQKGVNLNTVGKQEFKVSGIKDFAEFSVAEIDQYAQDDPNGFAEQVLTAKSFAQGGGDWDYEMLNLVVFDGENPAFRAGLRVGGEEIKDVTQGIGIALKALGANEHPKFSANPKTLKKASGASRSKVTPPKKSKSTELDFDVEDFADASDLAFAGF